MPLVNAGLRTRERAAIPFLLPPLRHRAGHGIGMPAGRLTPRSSLTTESPAAPQ